MTIRDHQGRVDDLIPVRNVLISVFDKTGLEELVSQLLALNPQVHFLSTGGTYAKIAETLPEQAKSQLIEIAAYTGFPEMEGGLVKTLHPKVHAGILAERNNPHHKKYLTDDLKGAVYIDLVVVNLYPFERVIQDPNVSLERARGHIDIGGPTMLRAAAKNFLGCAALTDPVDYTPFLRKITAQNGATSLPQRLSLASKVFALTTRYDQAIAQFMSDKAWISDLGEYRKEA